MVGHLHAVSGLLAMLSAGVASAASAATGLQAIPQDWKRPEHLQQLRFVGASASSTFGPDYRPELAFDGNRGSKWVASDEATAAKPQWLTLRLAGPYEVCAVAVFGEALGNDGLNAGAVQVAEPGGTTFRTVLEVPAAPGRSWLATFAPVKTTAVRLLITQSEGPSTHTDIYEVMAFGTPMPPEQMLAYLEERLAAAEPAIAAVRTALASPEAGALLRRLGLPGNLEALGAQLDEARRRRADWDGLSEAARGDLFESAERLAMTAMRLQEALPAMVALWGPRLADIDAARAGGPGAAIGAERRDGRVRLASRAVVVDLDEASGTWGATWLGAGEAALRGAVFTVEVDGKVLSPVGVKAEVVPAAGGAESGSEIVQTWGRGVVVERRLRVWRDQPVVVVSGTVTNGTAADVVLGRTALVDLGPGSKGWWHAEQAHQSPGLVTVAGDSLWVCEPVGTESGASERSYGGTMVLALAHQEPSAVLLAGFITGQEGRPRVSARFRAAEAGTALTLAQNFLGRRLAPGQRLVLDAVEMRAESDPWAALAHYGDDIVAASPRPVRKAPTALWCSWYAHRMAMTEELVLANAAVAAKHFRPLGLEIMQLDHGWQRGDVTGDWVANARFPHGLKWLAEELRTRHGLRLGVWISPTDVADVSAAFKAHPGWMLTDEKGQPRVNWRWYWAPNPNCYELDASEPDAYRSVRDTFARLSGEGVSYYKIDFLAACGGEHFSQHDPYCTRGWGVLRRAMEAIRDGAGTDAFIRYCQPPPLLAVGLADAAYGGTDLLDGGTPGVVATTRENARALAASWWVNDRLYRREVCDLSIRMQAAVEEVRLRLALMALAGCSISFSDEFQYLPPSRIRLMQKVLPPGVPALRPLDLFQRTIPSVWHLHCERPFGSWEVIGLFNHEDSPQLRRVDLAALGLKGDEEAAVFEFWEERFVGLCKGRVELELPPNSSRVLFVHRLTARPQLLGTDMHILGGYHDVTALAWDQEKRVLSGRCRRLPGASGRVYLYIPPGYTPRFDFPLNAASANLTNLGGGVWMKELEFREAEVAWTVPFAGAAATKRPEPGL